MKNISKKRDAVYNVICSTDTHPTAEWVYNRVKEIYPNISLGTVYRNISDLKNEGRIISVGIVDGFERFDGCTASHTHFICDKCGAVIDIPGIDVPASSEDLNRVNKEFGVKATSGCLTYRGYCNNCK